MTKVEWPTNVGRAALVQPLPRQRCGEASAAAQASCSSSSNSTGPASKCEFVLCRTRRRLNDGIVETETNLLATKKNNLIIYTLLYVSIKRQTSVIFEGVYIVLRLSEICKSRVR